MLCEWTDVFIRSQLICVNMGNARCCVAFKIYTGILCNKCINTSQ